MRAAEKAQDERYYTLVFEQRLAGYRLNINLANTYDQVYKQPKLSLKAD